MLEVVTLPLGSYQTNCYLIWRPGETACAVIDPGGDPERLLQKVRDLGLSVEAILLTHGHFDHVGAVDAIAQETGCPVWLHPADLTLPESLTAGPLHPTRFYEDGDSLNVAGLTITVLHTPGHTPGSVCLLTEDTLFSGDTLFAGSCGRCDLHGGSWEQMLSSLGRLGALSVSGTVYPGHGGATTLGQERQANPFLQRAMQA